MEFFRRCCHPIEKIRHIAIIREPDDVLDVYICLACNRELCEDEISGILERRTMRRNQKGGDQRKIVYGAGRSQ